jgi:hypothetical protein
MAEGWRHHGKNRKYDLAAQDQAISINHFKRKTLTEIQSRCYVNGGGGVEGGRGLKALQLLGLPAPIHY